MRLSAANVSEFITVGWIVLFLYFGCSAHVIGTAVLCLPLWCIGILCSIALLHFQLLLADALRHKYTGPTYITMIASWSATLAQNNLRWHEDADCPPNIQLFRGQDLCSCCHTSLEQFAVRLKKSRRHTPWSGGRWRHFYLDSPTTAHCELC